MCPRPTPTRPAAAKTITLTVTDNQGLTNTTTRTVNVTVGGGGGGGNQPVPGHTRLVPDQPRNNTPRISTGEIWDMEVVGTGNAARVFIAGNFTSAANTITPTTTINQAYLAGLQPQHRPDRHHRSARPSAAAA